MSESVFKPAWQKRDPKLERDAIAFWEANRLLPKNVDPKTRVAELCGLVYRDEEVIAVSTVKLGMLPRFRCRMAMYRCAAARSFRKEPFSLQVTLESRDLLERWSAAHPEEAVMGMAAVIESKLLERHMPGMFWPAGLIFMGYMPDGKQLRISWFKHATVNKDARKRRHGFGQVEQS